MAKEKIRFKIKVREIGFGFIATIENTSEIEMDERHCEDESSLIGQIKEWVSLVLKKQED